MSYYFKALSRRIPELFLLAEPGTNLIVISPWLQNVLFQPPSFGSGIGRWQGSELTLGAFLVHMAHDYQHPITLIVRAVDNRVTEVVSDFTTSGTPPPRILETPYLHAKAIVTDAFVVQMSANLLTTSLARNVETCALTTNSYGSATKWVERELGIHLDF